ncbi:YfjI family protein [Desulforegula conservatrix]|uniref:YfjI family protein n=1 Tax=Desulforegula conservatrix TaxID=153026 RepID=UPI000480657A|nr:YfjI family protein [Desulforegula conservatrix]
MAINTASIADASINTGPIMRPCSFKPIMSAADQAKADKEDCVQQGPEPLPLIRPALREAPFPVSSLPPAMRSAAECMREIIQAPMDMICHCLLASATAAIQPYVDVEIDGRRSPTSNNYLAVGESGERKSECDKVANKPIKDLIEKEQEKFFDEEPVHRIIKCAWQKRIDKAIKDGKSDQEIRQLLNEIGPEPKLILPVWIITDPTCPAIVRAFSEGRTHLMLQTPEAAQFLGGYSMNKDNQASTISGLSLFWDGAPITKSTIGGGFERLSNIRFGINLMFQPTFIPTLFSNQTAIGQGFIARCLCSSPESTIGERIYESKKVLTDPRIKDFYSRISGILERPLPLHEKSGMGLNPRCLHLTPSAKKTAIDFIMLMEKGMRKNGELCEIKDFASKAAEHALREAGKISFFENPDTEVVSLGALVSGIEIVKYYLGEQLRLRSSGSEDPDVALAQKVFEWGMNTENNGKISMSVLYQYGPSKARTKKDAERIIRILEDHNRAVRLEAGAILKGKFRSDVWELRGAA